MLCFVGTFHAKFENETVYVTADGISLHQRDHDTGVVDFSSAVSTSGSDYSTDFEISVTLGYFGGRFTVSDGDAAKDITYDSFGFMDYYSRLRCDSYIIHVGDSLNCMLKFKNPLRNLSETQR